MTEERRIETDGAEAERDPPAAETDGAEAERDPPAAGHSPWGPLTITEGICLPALGDAQFATVVFAQGIPHTAEANWATASDSLEVVLPHARSTVRAPRMQSALLDLEPLYGGGSLALVTLRRGTVHVRIAALEQTLVSGIEQWLRASFPGFEATEQREVPVRFWSCGAHGASSVSRTIAVPAWDEIDTNYPTAVRERLNRLMSPAFQPAEGGQLILWYGPPGTGKTYALRATGWEWRDWCELHYVIDPEVFFGQRADYMVDVLLDDDDPIGLDRGAGKHSAKWRLLVLEDTGELLAADAKERTGQGLSRLLNLVDGIVGQGLRVLVLVTTNEPLRRLHPAVARPGRCAARVEFETFAADEAAAWLEQRSTRNDRPGSATLAQLFAQQQEYEVEEERGLGFAG